MSGKFKTSQEEFWAGKFGDEYIERNDDGRILASRIAFLSKIFASSGPVDSLIEFGANIGLNLRAAKYLLPKVKLTAVEINKKACKVISSDKKIKVYNQSLLEFTGDSIFDFALVKGVLIHLNPDLLPKAYDILYNSTRHYICVGEYYSPNPVQADYRGHSGKLFKRDFAGEILDRFKDLRLIDYGFIYHRDPVFPQDDITWFLMEKR